MLQTPIASGMARSSVPNPARSVRNSAAVIMNSQRFRRGSGRRSLLQKVFFTSLTSYSLLTDLYREKRFSFVFSKHRKIHCPASASKRVCLEFFQTSNVFFQRPVRLRKLSRKISFCSRSVRFSKRTPATFIPGLQIG